MALTQPPPWFKPRMAISMGPRPPEEPSITNAGTAAACSSNCPPAWGRSDCATPLPGCKRIHDPHLRKWNLILHRSVKQVKISPCLFHVVRNLFAQRIYGWKPDFVAQPIEEADLDFRLRGQLNGME